MNTQLPNIYRKASLISILFLSLLMTSNPVASETVSSEQVIKEIQIASELHLKSQQLGFEWIMIKPYIAQAKQANTAGDFQRALTLAKHASELASLSIEQAENAEKNWTLAIPK